MRKLFFFRFGNLKVTVHKCAETIQGRKLYEEIGYLLKILGLLYIDVHKKVYKHKSKETDNFGVKKNCFEPKQANGHESHFLLEIHNFGLYYVAVVQHT